MEHEKQLIERRIVLPLVDPDLAEEYGVQPPRGVVLFGPPGTGKTTFAKAVASRLGWPFVEVFPPVRPRRAEARRSPFARRSPRSTSSSTQWCSSTRSRKSPGARRQTTLAAAGRHERVAQDHPHVPRARRPAAGLRDELRASARPGVPPPRPLRLRDPRRRPRCCCSRRDLEALYARRGPRTHRVDTLVEASELYRSRHRVRGAQGVAARTGGRGLRRRARSARRPRSRDRRLPRGAGRDATHVDDRDRR